MVRFVRHSIVSAIFHFVLPLRLILYSVLLSFLSVFSTLPSLFVPTSISSIHKLMNRISSVSTYVVRPRCSMGSKIEEDSMVHTWRRHGKWMKWNAIIFGGLTQKMKKQWVLYTNTRTNERTHTHKRHLGKSHSSQQQQQYVWDVRVCAKNFRIQTAAAAAAATTATIPSTTFNAVYLIFFVHEVEVDDEKISNKWTKIHENTIWKHGKNPKEEEIWAREKNPSKREAEGTNETTYQPTTTIRNRAHTHTCVWTGSSIRQAGRQAIISRHMRQTSTGVSYTQRMLTY